MRAVPITRHGGPEVLTLQHVADPVPGPADALVRVEACALNHLDLWQRRGLARVTLPLPHIPGSDIAGQVVEAGGSGLSPGTPVLVYPGISCGVCARCTAGDDNHCPQFGVIGYQSEGGYGELVAVPARNLVPRPAGIDAVTGAAFPLTFLTAWHMLVGRAAVQAGETVLVMAGGSGVGQAAIQVARLHGARVIVTTGRAGKEDRARALGADAVVSHANAAFAAEVRALTNNRGVDVVIEHVGEAVWDQAVRCLAPGGRLVTCGATSGHAGHIDLRVLFVRQLSLLGSYMGTRAEFVAVVAALADGRLAPVVDSVFSLEDAAGSPTPRGAGAVREDRPPALDRARSVVGPPPADCETFPTGRRISGSNCRDMGVVGYTRCAWRG
jgi:NADPH:quinone reductase-like Zn-dependent oxidoreductase